MAANDQMANLQDVNRIFDRCRHATDVRIVGRRNVSGVPANKDIARIALQQETGNDTRIRARDHRRQRMLLVRKLAKCVCVFRIYRSLKSSKSIE
jgi:hypothetical protein